MRDTAPNRQSALKSHLLVTILTASQLMWKTPNPIYSISKSGQINLQCMFLSPSTLQPTLNQSLLTCMNAQLPTYSSLIVPVLLLQAILHVAAMLTA